MPPRFFMELIGKECDISLRNDDTETGILLEVDGTWLKLDDNGRTLLINSEHVCSISADPEEEPEEPRRKRWGR